MIRIRRHPVRRYLLQRVAELEAHNRKLRDDWTAAIPIAAIEQRLRDHITAKVEQHHDPYADDEWGRGYNVAIADALRHIRGDDTPGLERVRQAVAKARGSEEAPPMPRGYA